MPNSNEKAVYFHVGLGKTGTTFLQYRVFPKLRGIYYIQRTRYQKAKKIIEGSHYQKYLVSREFDRQFEQEVKSFSSSFPNATPIIVFRRQDSYIASQYRRFTKNGFRGEFKDFFDLDNDSGFFKKHDLDYSRHLQILEEHFPQKPIVLIYDDLRDNPYAFIEKFVELIGVSINYDDLNFSKKHTSYSEKQLKAIKALGKYINLRKRRKFKNNLLHIFWRLYFSLIRYSTLYIAKFLPKKWFDDTPLIPNEELNKIKTYYQDDWEKVLKYSKTHQDIRQ